MPDPTLSPALKEAYALAPSNLAHLETLQFSHPALPGGDIYIVKNTVDLNLTLEDATVKTFRAMAFTMARPQKGPDGLQQLPIAVDNVGLVLSDFIRLVKTTPDKITVTYRPYLSRDLTTPQMNPPLRLWLTDVVITETQVQGNCIFMDVINRPFPTEYYTRQRFPGLAN